MFKKKKNQRKIRRATIATNETTNRISNRSHVEQQRSRRYSTHAPCSTRVPANGISVALEQACNVVSSKQCRFHDTLALDRWFQRLGSRDETIRDSCFALRAQTSLRGKLNYSKDGDGEGMAWLAFSREMFRDC